MFTTIFLFNALHPGRVLVGSESEFPKRTRQQKKEEKAQKKEAKRQKKEERKEEKERRKQRKDGGSEEKLEGAVTLDGIEEV